MKELVQIPESVRAFMGFVKSASMQELALMTTTLANEMNARGYEIELLHPDGQSEYHPALVRTLRKLTASRPNVVAKVEQLIDGLAPKEPR